MSRVFRCRRCGNLVTSNTTKTVDKFSDSQEDRCPDPKAPGGY